MRRLVLAFFVLLTACVPHGPTERETPIPPTRTPVHQPTSIATQIPTAIKTSTPTPVPTRVSSYTVVSGDTIIGIAEKFGVSWGYLADRNKLEDPNFIQIGQVLTIPEWPPKDNGKEVYLILSRQKAYAIENGNVIREFIVSTGVPAHPTVTGHYTIYVKYKLAEMYGPGYDLANVPWVMYFYQGYGLHGTYWHHNFGTPMSYGCVNLLVEDAEWLFGWTKVGTSVVIVD